jgi:hypothetical protein
MSMRKNKPDNKPESKQKPLEALCWVYAPLPSQKKFGAERARFKGFSGPVGSGKSAALCFEVIRQSYINRGRQGLVAAPTFSMLRDATLASLMGALDAHDVSYILRKADGEIEIQGAESLLLLRSLEEPERLRGTNLAWFAVDELSYAKSEGWLRLQARLRDPKAANLCGFAVWTPQGNDWIYKRFIQSPVQGTACVRAKPFENRYLLDSTPDYYERLKASYDPRFYSQEVLGEYLNSKADRVYHCFNTTIHVAKQQYDPRKPLLWALDFNVTPMSSVIVQQHGDKLNVIDEIVLERATTEEACEEFLSRYGSHASGLEIFGDASGRHMQTTGKSDYAVVQTSLSRAGVRQSTLRVPASNPAVLSRVQKVNALLTNAYGEVRLEIAPRCKELIKDLEEVLFKPDTGVLDKMRDPKRTHASDALGYLVWALYGNKQVVGEMNKRLL